VKIKVTAIVVCGFSPLAVNSNGDAGMPKCKKLWANTASRNLALLKCGELSVFGWFNLASRIGERRVAEIGRRLRIWNMDKGSELMRQLDLTVKAH